MARSNLRPYAFVWGNIENSVSQNVFKTNGSNLQYAIKVANLFSYSQTFTSRPRLDVRLTGDQKVTGSTPTEAATFFRGDLIMKYFLLSFSPFH